MTHKDTISIMPDYGMAPYAWLRRAGQTRGVGGCIADSTCGFPDEFGVSRGLQKSFERWACYFECNVKPGREKDFDWESFHLRGRELTKRLEEEIGDRFNIFYVLPWEDPESKRQIDRCHAVIRKLLSDIKDRMLKGDIRDRHADE